MDKTIEVFGREGIDTSLKDVAKELGCAESLIYRYYETRENVTDQCFRKICREIISVLQNIEFPQTLNTENLIGYLRKSWVAYFAYLRDNPLKKRYYLQYTMTGKSFPTGYDSPKDVVAKILKENFNKFQSIEMKDIEFISEYMISIANNVALSVDKEWFSEYRDAPSKVFDIMVYGIFHVVDNT